MGIISVEALAANQVVFTVAAATIVVSVAIGGATAIRVAYGIGAGNPTQAQLSGYLGIAMGVAFMAVAACVFLAAPEALTSCSIPDGHIDPRRWALFVARFILGEVRDGGRACRSLHKQATTTPKVRAAIQASAEPARVLAERYGISEQTVWKWRKRDSVHDRSHTPHRLQTTLTPAQEAVAVSLRRALLLLLDDLLAVVREFLNPDVSRSGLERCLRRHGMSKLPGPEAEGGEARPQAVQGLRARLLQST